MTKSTSTFSEFFREDAKGVQDILKEGGTKEEAKVLPFATTADLPVFPKAEAADEDELNAWWHNLRTFFRSGKGGGLPAGKKGMTAFPALLAPYRNREHVRSDYPFWMADEKSVEKDNHCSSLSNLLIQTIDSFAEEGEVPVLRANVIRIVEEVRKRIKKEGNPVLFRSVIDEALEEVQKKLNIKGDEGTEVLSDLKKLKDKLPQSGVLIPFSPIATFQVFAASLATGSALRRNALKKELSHLRAKLKDTLAVEIEKSPEGKQPKKLRSSFDFADSHLNFDELASVLPESGSELMPEDRFKRIEKVLKTLEGAEATFNNSATILIQKELHADKSFDWKNLFDGSEVKPVATKTGCAEATKAFEQQMKGVAEVIAAMRIGQLELGAKYDPQVHGDYFATFDWRSFTDEEMAACPPVVFITEVASLVNFGLSDFSGLLSSNIPVKMLAVKRDARIDYRMNGSQKPGEFMFQQELGALAVSHRNTYAMQSTPVSPSTLFEGFAEGITAFSPALFYVLTPSIEAGTDAYLWTSAAVEGREFPGFTYKGTMGSRWGSRFNIGNNPQSEADWPVHELKAKGEDALSVPFTFADFAAQDSLYSTYFLIVPPQYWSDDLLLLSDYLSLSDEELYAKVPYIWMVDNDNVLQKAAIAWPLVLACKERLDFWNYLQESGGVNSYHVEQAMKQAEDELKAEAEKELNVLKEEHEKEIEKVRDETANQAMEKLTSMLLDLDTASIVTAAPSTAPVADAPPSEEEATTEEPPPAEEEEEDLSLDEPWIETPLCTSCNECTDLNGKLFQYNADKMAFVADPKGGTFANIVQAAEKCPVKIIHPGEPLNPDEPNLDDLKKRAEKFN